MKLQPFGALVAIVTILAAQPTHTQSSRQNTPAAPAGEAAAGGLLVQQSNLVYVGSFRVPRGPNGGKSGGFDYGGGVVAFNPEHGSLFMLGHDWDQWVGELEVPSELGTGPVDSWPVAKIKQPLTDPVEGVLKSINPTDPNSKKVGGLLAWQDKLYLTGYSYYDGSGTQKLSHFVTGTDFSVRGDVTGPVQVGTLKAGYVSGYLAPVPESWQSQFGGPVLTGNCCLSVISRSSFGPAVFAFDPSRIGTSKDPVPASPLLYYTQQTPSPGFNGTWQIGGVVFPEGTRSVLFFGRLGNGAYCYGEGTPNEALRNTPVPKTNDQVKYCFDPTSTSKGDHGFPYGYFVWAYDAADLAAVKRGKKKPDSVQPYARWEVTFSNQVEGRATHAPGVAYDAKNNRIYLSVPRSETAYPVVHVYEIK